MTREADFFTSDKMQDALRRSGLSTALGPDQLDICHLRNLDPLGIACLTFLLNPSLRATDVPNIWKNALVIFIPKAGMPIHLDSSYRPISLLCPAAKVLERLLLPFLQRHLPVAYTQHDYRKHHCTTPLHFFLWHIGLFRVSTSRNRPAALWL